MRSSLSVLVGVAALAGCALKGDVRRVELQVAALKDQVSGAEAARKAQADSLLTLIAALQQALTAQHAYFMQWRGDMRTDHVAVQQQLVAIGEILGQSQQRLTELRGRLEQQSRQPVPQVESAPGVPVGPSGNPTGPGPDEMYEASLKQYRGGSLSTARLGFREFLRLYPSNDRADDALFYIGETFATENADSASAVYQQVVKTYPNSSRAPAALYKLGLLAESRGNKPAARTYYQRVIAGYPRSDEANLARDKLQRLGK